MCSSDLEYAIASKRLQSAAAAIHDSRLAIEHILAEDAIPPTIFRVLAFRLTSDQNRTTTFAEVARQDI